MQASMSTIEELQSALADMRRRYGPFLDDVAPQMPQTRAKWVLDEFKWRQETQEDVYFVSLNTGHKIAGAFQPTDFWLWYDDRSNRIEPLLSRTIQAPGWTAILASGNANWQEHSGNAMATVELAYGHGYFRICEVELDHRFRNPTATILLDKLLTK